MAFTAVSAFAVGRRLKAAALNLIVTALTELQTEATKPIYDSTRTGLTQANNSNTFYSGSWSTSNGYTSSGGGVTVPKAGTYLVQQYVQRTAGAWSTRALHEILANGVLIARQSVDAGVGESSHCVQALTQVLSAGQLIVPQYFQTSGGTCTVNVTLRIIFLGNN